MDASRVHLFGIRHHGPGSAHSLERALDALDPASVLIEGPPEADEVIRVAASPEMRPPMAVLVYAENEPSTASFYPFAAYSPEWRALLWALRRGRRVRFIDLPAANRLADRDDADILRRRRRLRRDPLGHLAELAGYSDSEAWWNNLIEQGTHAPALFAAIEQAMTVLRDLAQEEEDEAERTLETRREAHMRLAIADEEKDVEGNIAVVTGAWHVPALRRPAKKGDDRAVLRGLPSVKTVATWVPWTEKRLAAGSGYGAGVVSPGWYGHLWSELRRDGGEETRRRLTSRWQARAAGLLREAGRPVSTASVIDAVRLAEGLAALRGLALPGLEEMQDASLAALCEGEPAPLKLIFDRLVIGSAVGEVAADAPQPPLQLDLARTQRRLRLKPEALPQEISLDLRSEAGLAKSTLLHRLRLLDIPWGELLDAGSSRGTFRERWQIEWTPELSVRVVEAVVWGTTVEQAAANRAAARAAELQNLAELAELVGACLLADLPEAARAAIARVEAEAVRTGDLTPLIEAVPPLANVRRYGTARRLPEEELLALLTALVERVCVGYLHQCRQLDAEAAANLRRASTAFDGAVLLLGDDRLLADWQKALSRVADDVSGTSLLRGFAARRLYDQGVADGDATAKRLSLALSAAVPPEEAGAWLDGFLGEAAQLLLHDERLRALVDAFLVELPEEAFTPLLPMLRRAFATLDSVERQRLMAALREKRRAASDEARSAALSPRFAEALPLLETILGIRR